MTAAAGQAGQVALVVDDVETTRYVFRRWLRSAGFEVLEAGTGAEALEILASTVPDIAVLDVNLPDMTGYDVCEAIKANPATAGVPVLHVSATAVEVADRSTGLRRGADAYLVEPLEREELLATVDALLRYADARRSAERLAGQLAALHAGLDDVHAATTTDELAIAAARSAAAILDRRLAVVAYAHERGSSCVAAPDGTIDCGPHQPGSLLESAERDFVPDATAVAITTIPRFSPSADLRPRLAWLDDRTAQLFAIRTTRGDGLSALVIEDELDDDAERLLAKHIVRAVGTAVDNLRGYEREKTVALTLQRALLPDRSPHIDGLDIATRYVPGEEHNEVGGDFYDAFALDERRVALAIGDVAGHSPAAASTMGELRTALRAYALDGLKPAAVVERTNTLFSRFNPTMIATLCYLVLDQAEQQLTIVNAGHLPPLIATPEGAWWLQGGCTLLGVDATPPEATVVALPAGATLVLATDGLVERRTRHLDEGLAIMADAVRTAPIDDVDATCQAVVERCERHTGRHSDDIAVMVVRPHGPSGSGSPRVVSGDQVSVEAAG